MYICGLLNCANKDAGAAVIYSPERPGVSPRYVAISEERLARVKNSYFSPVRSIKYCLDAFGLESLDQIDYFVTDWIAERRFLNSNRAYRKLENDYIMSKLRIPASKLIIAESHHCAHAASAFYPSGFEEAAILIVDGVGSDMETISLYRGSGTKIEFIERSRFYGLGQLYTAISRKVLMLGTAEEGKTMGLAPYGRDKPGPILKINGRYRGLEIDYSKFLERLPETVIKQELPPCSDRAQVTNEYYSRIAFDVQDEIERALLHLADYACKKTGLRRLCMAGGVALNCVANNILLDKGVVDELFVQPASSDTGIPFGLALIGYHQFSRTKTKLQFPHAYTGRNYSVEEATSLFGHFKTPHRAASVTEVAQLIADGNVVGWFHGGSEYGPRALGHRSILADPRNPYIRDVLNAKVKHRELYRPFAPSVLAEHAEDYFDLGGRNSPFMLLAPQAKARARQEIPAVVHVDNTARVQTVTSASGAYHDLLNAFSKITGTPVLLNTSFNDNGEPIVETPLDALLCFMRTNIDYLCIEGQLVARVDILRERSALVARIDGFRDEQLLQNYRLALDCCCESYNGKEMVNYLLQESLKSKYYATEKALDDLEDQLTRWAEAGSTVAVITDSHHRKLLEKLREFKRKPPEVLIEIEDILEAAEGFDISCIAGAQCVLVFVFSACYALQNRLANAYLGQVYCPYSPYSRKLPGDLVVPAQDGSLSNYDDLELLSYEASRNKDWGGFFETARGRLAQQLDQPFDAKPVG